VLEEKFPRRRFRGVRQLAELEDRRAKFAKREPQRSTLEDRVVRFASNEPGGSIVRVKLCGGRQLSIGGRRLGRPRDP